MNQRVIAKQESNQRIRHAAEELFIKRGFVGAGVDEIMEKAGLTAGAFYAHFRSKEELQSRVIDEALHKQFEKIKDEIRESKRAQEFKAKKQKTINKKSRLGRGQEVWSLFFDRYFQALQNEKAGRMSCFFSMMAGDILRQKPREKRIALQRLMDIAEFIQAESGSRQRIEALFKLASSLGIMLVGQMMEDKKDREAFVQYCRDRLLSEKT